MRGPRGARCSAKSRFASIIRNICIFLLVTIGSSLLLYTGLNVSRGYEPPILTALHGTIVTNGADRWNGDEEVKAPDFNFPAPAARTLSVSPLFQSYYSDHSGATSLEAPVTPAFPIGQGWIQFFATGALLLPVAQHAHPRDAGEDAVEDSLELLIESGVRDSSSGIIRLPLLRALLTVGSLAPVGGDGSSLTYADLRRATAPNLMRPEPAAGQQLAQASGESQSMFIKTGMRAGKDIGHLVPPAIWNYIRRPDISPDGWRKDFGEPLTEAISFPLLKDGQIHRMLVQAFWRDGVVIDQTAFDAWGYPLIQRLATSVDYLRTLDLPPLVISAQQTAWAQGETALLNAPGGSQVVANIEPYFQLTLLGDSAWKGGMLWYYVQWTAGNHTGNGWVSAAAISFNSPGNVAGQASFDALSPDLASYLAGIGNDINVVVYDETHQQYYTYRPDNQFVTGSSIKVAIMLAFLDRLERARRRASGYEMNLLTTMIENSNNDSAGILYNDEVGGAAGVADFLQRIGVKGLDPYPSAFGWSLISPLAMVHLLTLLHDGEILTPRDRGLALYLMEHIEPDQRVGVGDTAPAGAVVAMKDGWVIAPDGRWAMNSSGIVSAGQQAYLIAVYTQDLGSLADEQAVVRYVCGTVASLLATLGHR